MAEISSKGLASCTSSGCGHVCVYVCCPTSLLIAVVVQYLFVFHLLVYHDSLPTCCLFEAALKSVVALPAHVCAWGKGADAQSCRQKVGMKAVAGLSAVRCVPR